MTKDFLSRYIVSSSASIAATSFDMFLLGLGPQVNSLELLFSLRSGFHTYIQYVNVRGKEPTASK